MSDREKALAKMKKRSSGAYSKVKDTEAQAGGRKLPGGLENEIGIITGASLGLDKNDNPFLQIKASAKTPEAYMGVPCGMGYFFNESEWSTYDDNVAAFVNDMKLLGFNADDFDDEIALADHVCGEFSKHKKAFYFNTGTRPNKSGEYKPFIAGIPEDDAFEDDVKGEAKRPPRKTKSKVKACPFEPGDTVETTGDHYGDGNTYTGVVDECGESTVSVRFDDDNALDDIPFDNLIKRVAESEEAPFSPNTFEETDAVVTTGDYFEVGEEYEGTVVTVNEDSCTVEFEDETVDVPFDNLAAAS